MADPTTSSDQDDPLAFFEPEPGFVTKRPAMPASAATPIAPAPVPISQRLKVDAPSAVTKPAPADELAFLNTPLPHERMAAAAAASSALELVRPAPIDFDVEVLGPPPPAGSVSFDHVCSVKGLGFVEGVALIQAASAAVTAAGPNAGVPELHGLFLTSAGDVVLHGPPTGEPPARELARLLHQLVAPNLMPPAGRLFIGRWINNDLAELTEFSSEIAYFARPNGQELLVGLHGRCNGVAQPVAEVRRRPERSRHAKASPPKPEVPQNLSALLRQWVREHKPEVTAAIAVIAAATLAALGTWIWQARTMAASRARVEVTQSSTADDAVNGAPPEETAADSKPPVQRTSGNAVKPPTGSKPPAPLSGGSAAKSSIGSRPPAGANRNRALLPPIDPSRGGSLPPGPTSPIQPQVIAGAAPPTAAASLLPSSAIPDLRIYSATDAGVEPPVLRSAEILEVLLGGFQTRENVIELIISEKGEVQQARMVGAPQRIPDVMLLSRAKEMRFDPAVRNGVPVRYRVRLSWRVTP